eukprot:gene7489-8279_t
MSKSMIYNDDYCDLPDGSDEPGTSACSYLKVFFHCLDKHCQPVLIPTSRVNDGVCDCGDGSDEWDTRYSSRTCTNHCLRPPPAHPSPRTNNTTVFLRRGTNLVTSTSAITSTISLTSHSSSQGLGVSLEVILQMMVLLALVIACLVFLSCRGRSSRNRKSSSLPLGTSWKSGVLYTSIVLPLDNLMLCLCYASQYKEKILGN